MSEVRSPKKLIEVALPLDDINAAAAREKSIRHGHPSTLHLWWARRPLAAARAVLFAQLVNDPGYQRELGFGVNKKEAEIKREKLFQIIRDLVKWENTNNEEVLNRARAVIWDSWRETCHLNRNHPEASELFNPEKLPAFHDPFAGGGAIPLEAQRLGLESYASDLNPVAVMINKAMIEIPPKFAGRPPVGPIPAEEKQQNLSEDWSGAKGLAEDVRRYGHWMREEAFKRIGHLYPKVKITRELVAARPDLEQFLGEELTVIAWLWTRTVKCPNPACGCEMPLLSSLTLSSKKGNEAFLNPKFSNGRLEFEVADKFESMVGDRKTGFKRGMSGIFACVSCGGVTTRNYVADQGVTIGLGSVQTAVVCEARGRRVYLPPSSSEVSKELPEVDSSSLQVKLSPNPRDVWCRNFGLITPADLFSARQLVAMTTFSDLVGEARKKVIEDAKVAGVSDGGEGLEMSGSGATAYGDALAVYLLFAINKGANLWSTATSWMSDRGAFRETFARQAIPMVWDYAEANPFSNSGGNILSAVDKGRMAIEHFPASGLGRAFQYDAAAQNLSSSKVISTDPPYYDNIGYADLSDFFYVWMRRSLREIFPSLLSTIAVPKAEELIAAPYRLGSKEKAEAFFMEGMTRAIHKLAVHSHPAFPVTIYYAFKQSETSRGESVSAGWVTFLEAVIQAGFSIEGTWPVRTEGAGRIIAKGTNALASSIVLVCRKRQSGSKTVSRREFQRQLREDMPEALETMIGGEAGRTPIAPVDLAQSSIGPGMAIYSKYETVLNQDGSRMGVHDALVLINRAITEYLSPDSGSFDTDTQFCSAWFDQYGWGVGPFGEANTLAQAKGTTVDGAEIAGVVESGGGKVRLLKWAEYDPAWDPTTDKRLPIWEACHQLIRLLNADGESAAGEMLARMPEKGEPVRQLAYHLYTLCERKKWAEEARAYNELITAWHAIVAASLVTGHSGSQSELEF